MDRWEYKTSIVDTRRPFEDDLSREGFNGWELCSASSIVEGKPGIKLFIFKRRCVYNAQQTMK